jgi:hypothetical protein
MTCVRRIRVRPRYFQAPRLCHIPPSRDAQHKPTANGLVGRRGRIGSPGWLPNPSCRPAISVPLSQTHLRLWLGVALPIELYREPSVRQPDLPVRHPNPPLTTNAAPGSPATPMPSPGARFSTRCRGTTLATLATLLEVSRQIGATVPQPGRVNRPAAGLVLKLGPFEHLQQHDRLTTQRLENGNRTPNEGPSAPTLPSRLTFHFSSLANKRSPQPAVALSLAGWRARPRGQSRVYSQP